MSPKNNHKPSVEQAVNSSSVKGRRIQSSHKMAAAILLLAVLWMASGLFNDDTATTGAVPAETIQDANAAMAEPKKPHVRVTTITSQDHTRQIAILGRIEADKAVTVRAEVTGRVAEVVATKGAKVDTGDVLVKIDPENVPALLAEARARLEQRKIAYESARKLSKGGYSSQLSVAQAKADMEAARAQVTGMKRNLDNATIKAPLAGVVDDLPVEVGDYIDKVGVSVARVIDLTRMIAVGEVTERDIANIQLGGAAHVRLPDDRVLEGTVSYVSRSSNTSTRTFRVEVTVAVPDGSVSEGMTAELHLPMERIVAHKISPALLTLNDNGSVGVKTVDEAGIVVFNSVKMVSDTQDGIWLTGLPQHAQIITVGQEFVAEGQAVIAVEGELKTMGPRANATSANETGN